MTPIGESLREEGVLLALAATAYHAVAATGCAHPDLIVGHGVLGRLIARLVTALADRPPVVWEHNPNRVAGAAGYTVIAPDADTRRDYRSICDVSGDSRILDTLIGRLGPGGEIVLAGFYSDPLSFAFPAAFMREARIRVAAEWRDADIVAVKALIDSGRLDLGGLITHRHEATDARASLPHGVQRSLVLENDLGLESAFMSTSLANTAALRSEQVRLQSLRDEAAVEPDAVATAAPTKQTQVIAIYGKGGIGKSFALANLSYMMAQQGKKVLLIGCDPKSDTTSLLFGGRACPTIIETSAKKKLAGEPVKIGDVCFKRDGVFAMELGGPEVGRGCGGRGIIHGFELLEKLGFHEWGFDYVLLDFLGDVVCGGFGLPIARDMCQKVIVVGSNDLQSLYVANNVCSAVEYFPQARRQRRRRRAWSSTRTTARARRRPSPRPPASRCWPRFPPTRTSAARARITTSSAGPAAPGVRCSSSSRPMWPKPRRFAPNRSPRMRCSDCSRARRSAATWCSNLRPTKTCAAVRSSRKPLSRSSTTPSDP